MWHQLPVRGNPEFHFHSVQHHSVTTVAQNCKNITNATKYMDINALWKYMNAINKAAQKLNPTIIIWYIDAFLEWKNTLYIDSTKKSICYRRCSLFRERVQLHKLVFFQEGAAQSLQPGYNFRFDCLWLFKEYFNSPSCCDSNFNFLSYFTFHHFAFNNNSFLYKISIALSHNLNSVSALFRTTHLSFYASVHLFKDIHGVFQNRISRKSY